MARQSKRFGGVNEYTDEDKELMFMTWLEHGKPTAAGLLSVLPELGGGKPSAATIYKYRQAGRWDERAAEVEELAIEKNRVDLADKRAEMFKRQAAQAEQLESKAIAYLLENEFKDMGVALKAWQLAVEEQRKALGVGSSAINVFALSNEKVGERLAELLGRLDTEEEPIVIDAPVVDDGVQE
jgi:hypothetical protein